MLRSPTQAVKFKRRALGWTVAKLAAESNRTVEEIHKFEDGDSSDQQLTAELLAPIDSAIAQVLPCWEQVLSDPDLLPVSGENKAMRKLKLVEFGKLLRDRRNKAQLTRIQLGKLAGLSDATIKFIETAWHHPSRRTCQALVGIKELKLKWEDVAKLGYVGPAPSEQVSAPAMAEHADLPAAPAPAPAVAEHADLSAAPPPAPVVSGHTSDSGEVIEEEIVTYVRRTIRRK